MNETSFGAYLAEHPRAIGALFALLVLLAQGQTAMAAGATIHCGP